MGICNDDGAKILASAIVEQAVMDYKHALAIDIHSLKALKVRQDIQKAKKDAAEIRRQYGIESEEYQKAKKRIIRNLHRAEKYNRAEYYINDCETFFNSQWFGMLVDIEPEWLIAAIKSSYPLDLRIHR